MKDQVLSIERMRHLKEFGVDTSKASLFWVKIPTDNKDKWVLSLWNDNVLYSLPTFTLQDILDLIPKNIITNDSHRDKVYFVADFSEKVMGYAYRFETCGEISYYRFFSLVDNIIDAAYEMLCWCAENGYITKIDKQ